MADGTAPAAANTKGPRPLMTTTVPSSHRGLKRGRGAEEDGGDVAAGTGAARGWPRRAAAGAAYPLEMKTSWWFPTLEEEQQLEVPAVPRWSSSLIDFPYGGGAKMGSDRFPVDAAPWTAPEFMATLLHPAAAGPADTAALYEDGAARCGWWDWDPPYLFPPPPPPSYFHYGAEFAHAAATGPSHDPAPPEEDVIADGFSATAGGGHTSAEFAAGGGAPADTYLSGSSGFDLNSMLTCDVSGDYEGSLVVPENAVVGQNDVGGGAKMGSYQDPVDAPGMREALAALLSPPSHYDFEIAAAGIVEGFAAAAAGDNTSTEFAGGGAPDTSSSGPFGFDLNQLLPSDVSGDEGSLVVPVVVDGSDSGGSVELAAEDGATARSSARGFDFDLNQPCPAELFPEDGEPDPSNVPDPAPAPAEDSLAAPDADEPPELPYGGAPVAPTRRRRSLVTRLWDWAFN